MARSRLAVALVIPDPFAVEIDGLRRALGSASLARIAPHVTLVPPVNVPDERMADALGVLERGAAAVAPVQLTLGPPDTFWPANPVVYLAVGGDVEVVGRLRIGLLVDPLERPDTRPFVPHVTIAERVEPPDRIPAALDVLGCYRAEVLIERVQLLRMDPERRWHVIAEAPLGGSRVVARGGLAVTLTTSRVVDPEAAGLLGEPFAVAARREGMVVGVATGVIDDQRLLLQSLVVHAGARGQGVGRQLLAEVEGLAHGRGIPATAVSEAGEETRSWLAAHGWTVDGACVRMIRR